MGLLGPSGRLGEPSSSGLRMSREECGSPQLHGNPHRHVAGQWCVGPLVDLRGPLSRLCKTTGFVERVQLVDNLEAGVGQPDLLAGSEMNPMRFTGHLYCAFA